MKRKTTEYVDTDAMGKAVSFDIRKVWELNGMDIKIMSKRLEAYKEARQVMNSLLDGILADTEKAMDKAGNLDSDHAIMPHFNYGNDNVARIVGQRHGLPRTKTVSNNAVANAVAFMKPVEQSRLIARRK